MFVRSILMDMFAGHLCGQDDILFRNQAHLNLKFGKKPIPNKAFQEDGHSPTLELELL